jgi:cysteinyl-tRNA synthetase
MVFSFYNTLTKKTNPFVPQIPGKATLYVCGPTVYDRAHLGNGRSAVVFDVLYRALRDFYAVTFVRNITDIDDKIIQKSQETGRPIDDITAETTRFYHDDMAAIGNVSPTIEPRATDHIDDMIDLIQILIEKGNAYIASGHVLFHVASHPSYGALSRCRLEDMIQGARVDVAPYKKDPTDFVLWKPSDDHQPGWDSPWGRGRPGWHIECSAMSLKHLGPCFDIHGGGQDLIFPHHENEIAQSTAAMGDGTFANVWLHNGMLTVRGEKMSKSLGNFITVHDLLTHAKGEVIRYAILSAHYRQNLDWTDQTLTQAKRSLDRLYNALIDGGDLGPAKVDDAVCTAVCDDLNTPLALSALHDLASRIHKAKEEEKKSLKETLLASGQWIGLFSESPKSWFQNACPQGNTLSVEDIEALIKDRHQARVNRDFDKADTIRKALDRAGIVLMDDPAGTQWRRT